jgi:hypothetical protein
MAKRVEKTTWEREGAGFLMPGDEIKMRAISGFSDASIRSRVLCRNFPAPKSGD